MQPQNFSHMQHTVWYCKRDIIGMVEGCLLMLLPIWVNLHAICVCVVCVCVRACVCVCVVFLPTIG